MTLTDFEFYPKLKFLCVILTIIGLRILVFVLETQHVFFEVKQFTPYHAIKA